MRRLLSRSLHVEPLGFLIEIKLPHYPKLGRQMFRDLQAIAAQQRCGTGGVIRYYLNLALAKAKAKSREVARD